MNININTNINQSTTVRMEIEILCTQCNNYVSESEASKDSNEQMCTMCYKRVRSVTWMNFYKNKNIGVCPVCKVSKLNIFNFHVCKMKGVYIPICVQCKYVR